MQTFSTANSHDNLEPLCFRGDRDYVHSSDFLGLLAGLLGSREGTPLGLRVDFHQPIRTHVRIELSGEGHVATREKSIASATVRAGQEVIRYEAYSEPVNVQIRKDETQSVVFQTYRESGFTADLSRGNLVTFLYSVAACIKAHWQKYHFDENSQPVIRRAELTLPLPLPKRVEGVFRSLKFGGQRWTFHDENSLSIPLKLDVLLLRTP